MNLFILSHRPSQDENLWNGCADCFRFCLWGFFHPPWTISCCWADGSASALSWARGCSTWEGRRSLQHRRPEVSLPFQLPFHPQMSVLWEAWPLLYFPTNVTMFLQEPKPRNKNPNIRHEKSSFDLFARVVYRLPKHTAYYCCLWLTSEVEGKVPTADCTSHTGLRLPWSGTGLDVPSLRTSKHSTRRHQESFQRRKSTNSPAWLWCLWSMATTRKSESWHLHLGNNQQLSS